MSLIPLSHVVVRINFDPFSPIKDKDITIPIDEMMVRRCTRSVDHSDGKDPFIEALLCTPKDDVKDITDMREYLAKSIANRVHAFVIEALSSSDTVMGDKK